MDFILFLFFFLVIVTMVYEFIPFVQLYLDHKWKGSMGKLGEFTNFLHDRKFHIPDHIDEDLWATGEEVSSPEFRHQVWGGPMTDGPDKSLFGSCVWRNGELHCKAHVI